VPPVALRQRLEGHQEWTARGGREIAMSLPGMNLIFLYTGKEQCKYLMAVCNRRNISLENM
jgi:hypothetical protein